tara:strand:+ start:323 stop:640 length:318 start_codon:yes stop_codon:yes gene_type:complete
MRESSKIDDFLSSCENLISQAMSSVESPEDFKKVAGNIKTFVEENWEEFSESISKLKSEGAIDEQLKLRLKAITQLIESLEDKAVIKNNWVNEFKQYIVNSEDIR